MQTAVLGVEPPLASSLSSRLSVRTDISVRLAESSVNQCMVLHSTYVSKHTGRGKQIVVRIRKHLWKQQITLSGVSANFAKSS